MLYVFIGGGLGSVARFAISRWLAPQSGHFPWNTLIVNILACAVLAWAVWWFAKHPEVDSRWGLMLMTGFCGGFSTFSTFSKETLDLIQSGQTLMAVAYVLASVLICLLVFILMAKFL